ncbi:MAG: hypothetical protein HQL23_09290, partial [Candidatus Omnitrophica bacterium]|nr:hypothetical protein [Candidatus Omnitrophota bacterium]
MRRWRPEKIYGWDGFRIEAGPVSYGVTPGIGGRIMSCRYAGEELFFVQEEYAGQTYDFADCNDLR